MRIFSCINRIFNNHLGRNDIGSSNYPTERLNELDDDVFMDILVSYLSDNSIPLRHLRRIEAELEELQNIHQQRENTVSPFNENTNIKSLFNKKHIIYEKYNNSSQDTCSICLDEFKEGVRIGKTSCNHIYHKKCINNWIDLKNSECPLCRGDLC